jgi:hypothetical protein
MDAHLTSSASYRVSLIDHPLSRMARRVIALSAALVLLLSVVVVIRGLLGAFEAPQSAISLMLAAFTAELLASVFRVVWRRLHPDATRRSALLARLGVPSICVLCLAIALSMAEAGGWAVGSLWLIVVGGELAWWYPQLRATQHRAAEDPAAIAVNRDSSAAVAEADEPIDEEDEIGADVIQQMTRSRNSDGVEVISGVLRAEFAPGERTQNLHVAFCPPLTYEPAVITHQLGGSPLTIKIGQSEIFGTRIELRRPEAASTSESATICFEVQPR